MQCALLSTRKMADRHSHYYNGIRFQRRTAAREVDRVAAWLPYLGQRLTASQFRVFLWHYYEGMTIAEIAMQHNTSERRITEIKKKCLKRLRHLAEKETLGYYFGTRPG